MTEVSFRTNVLLKSILGKDLITDDNIAVLELVKNSFDAGSGKVDIIFKNLLHSQDAISYRKINNSKLIVFDTGNGMSSYDIENKWLNIAYSEKKEKGEDYGRTLAGNKGVGRFSCDKLGKFLTIYTRQVGQPILKIIIDWRKFEQVDDIDLNIQDIKFNIEEISDTIFEIETGANAFKKGTYLEIRSLREEWDYSKVLNLKRQLERLINPNQSFKSIRFDIVISAKEYSDQEKFKPEFEQINGVVKNRIFEKLNFKVTNIQSKISSDGKYLITILKDRGNEIFSLVEENPFNLLKDIKIHIYYLNTYSKAYFTRQTGIRSIEFGSISLFINGFRIPPYGDFGNDWLGMEMRKSQGRTRYLGTREVIGRIEVKNNELEDDENDVFKIISSRSGIVNNDVYSQLSKSSSPFGYYYKTFRRLERFVVEGIKWDSIKDPKEAAALEKEILSNPRWKEDNEEYAEDALTRNRRIIRIIHNIIDAKSSEFLKIKINQSFVSELLEEHQLKVQTDLNEMLSQLNNTALTSDQISNLLDRINNSRVEIDEISNDIEKINPDLLNQDARKELDERILLIEKLKEDLIEERDRRIALEKANAAAEAEANRLKEELEQEKQKNTYLTFSSRDLSQDAKGLVHNIKITSKKISDGVDNLYDRILSGKFEQKQLLSNLASIKFQSEKALKISKIITRSNFDSDKNAQIVDVVKYIGQYLNIYSDIYPKNELNFEIKINDAALIKKISVLEISIIIDDLISNSDKAGAKNIEVEINPFGLENIEIFFSDDGDGVPQKFLQNKNKIFELGITTTEGGSGIGLNSVKAALKSLKGEISFIGNNIKLKGACFRIIL